MYAEYYEIRDRIKGVERSPDHVELMGASLGLIKKFEHLHGVVFPDVLKECLETVNGTCVGGGGLMGIETRLKVLDMGEAFSRYPSWKINGWFPVACDGSGNFYVLFRDGERFPVSFLDVHEAQEGLTYLVASSLGVFLKRFVDKECGKAGWPFEEHIVLEEDPSLTDIERVPLPWD